MILSRAAQELLFASVELRDLLFGKDFPVILYGAHVEVHVGVFRVDPFIQEVLGVGAGLDGVVQCLEGLAFGFDQFVLLLVDLVVNRSEGFGFLGGETHFGGDECYFFCLDPFEIRLGPFAVALGLGECCGCDADCKHGDKQLFHFNLF